MQPLQWQPLRKLFAGLRLLEPGISVTFPAKGELDCNGYSKIQKPLLPYLVCPDFAGFNGEPGEDNGHYVGHDEATVQVLSSASGSGDHVKGQIKLPKEHPLPATQTIENEDSLW